MYTLLFSFISINFIYINFFYFINIIIIIIIASYLTLLERLILALIQNRFGPSLVGGINTFLQPLVDGLKLLLKLKKNIINVNTYLFNFLFIVYRKIPILFNKNMPFIY